MCGEPPTALRMGVPALANDFVDFTVSLTTTQRQIAISSTYQTAPVARELEDGSRPNLNALLCLELTPTRTTLLCGLRISSMDP
jgi:hypothetical protein